MAKLTEDQLDYLDELIQQRIKLKQQKPPNLKRIADLTHLINLMEVTMAE